MAIGLVGRKAGMTRIFTEDGVSIPVTVVEVAPNRVTQLKNLESDGYCAIQVTTGTKRASRVNKAKAGHFSKAGVEAGAGLWEFRVNNKEAEGLELGAELTVERFNEIKTVDVSGTICNTVASPSNTAASATATAKTAAGGTLADMAWIEVKRCLLLK